MKIIFIFTSIIIILGLIIVFLLVSNMNKTSQENQPQAQEKTANDNDQSNSEKLVEQHFSVTFVGKPKYIGKVRSRDAYEFEILFDLTNNQEEMITNIGVNYCTVVYNGLKKNISGIGASEFRLSKALLKGESTSDPLKYNLNIYTVFLSDDKISCQSEEVDPKLAYSCSYADSGECDCEPVNYQDLKILGCEFAITDNGKQAGNDWGNYPHYFAFE